MRLYGRTVTPEEELEPIMAQLRRTHDLLPFLERQLSVGEASFRRLPDEMADVLAASRDFHPPVRGSGAVWFQLLAEDDRTAELVLARTSDGELWVVAPTLGS